jgi:hypothetical protein
MAPTAAAVAFTSDSSCEVDGAPIEPAKQSLQHGSHAHLSVPLLRGQNTVKVAAIQAACTLSSAGYSRGCGSELHGHLAMPRAPLSSSSW